MAALLCVTTQCPVNYRWRLDPCAVTIDAFLQDWSHTKGFANLPWCLIGRDITGSDSTSPSGISGPSVEDTTGVPITSDNVSGLSTADRADNTGSNQDCPINANFSTVICVINHIRKMVKEEEFAVLKPNSQKNHIYKHSYLPSTVQDRTLYKFVGHETS